MNRFLPSLCLLAFVALDGIVCGEAANAPPASVSALVKRSDLIVVAIPQEACSGIEGEGPIPDGIHPTPEYWTAITRLKILHVLKGDISSRELLWISYTWLHLGLKDSPAATPAKFSLSLKPEPKADENPFPGSPRQGATCVFFLQNRKQREPKSFMSADGHEIIYRNFDDLRSMMPATEPLMAEVERSTAKTP